MSKNQVQFGTSILDFALFYASKSWRVFPCKPKDKLPALKWADEATIDPDKIRAWWNDNPAYNIGIKCGAESGIIVLDVDADKGGDQSLLALIRDYTPMPITPESLTGGGGRHLLFKHPGVEIRNSASRLGPGLDIRGDGGYIVAPPSIHPNGNIYEWEYSGRPSKTSLAPMPSWMVGLLQGIAGRNVVVENAPNEAAVFTITAGERNASLTSMAGSMRRRGFEYDAIFAALVDHNKKHCEPPLSNDEIAIIAKSVSRYAPADVSVTQFAKGTKDVLPSEPKTAFEVAIAFTELLDNLEGRSIPTFITPVDRSLGGLERQTLTILAARPSMGKSSLAWQIGRNISAHNLKTLFVSLEMSSMALWARAACGACGVRWRDFRAGEATQEQREAVIVKTYELMNRYEDRLLIDDTMNTTDTVWQNVEKYRPDLVVVDHLRLLADKGEKEVQRLGDMSSKLKEISKAFNCAVLCLAQLNRRVEHEADKRPHLADLRESGHIEENADVVLMMYRDDYYDDKKALAVFSETEILVRKFRDDVLSQRIKLVYDLRHQWFEERSR